MMGFAAVIRGNSVRPRKGFNNLFTTIIVAKGFSEG